MRYDGIGYVVQEVPPLGIRPITLPPRDEKWFRKQGGRRRFQVREALWAEGREPNQPTLWVLVVHTSPTEGVVLPFFRGTVDLPENNTDLEAFISVCRHHRKAAKYAAYFVAETTVDADGKSGRIVYFLGNGEIAP
ncbi:hypothetical protein P9A16_03790 [Shinella sp. 838]|uniref:hypothetical protein n=1 Tax=Shinella sp. 838 TaxID=3038164 RepID=UPI002415109D|nr:hypothetical protein [Shinella sp. 838]MCA0343570.1 hypothetical protein [Pseudomonadota bacterium]MDG4670229.1 hypothetical protein [Shinella sp. 838]